MTRKPAGGFDDFVVGETRRLLGLAYAMAGNRDDAWDLTQETLVRIRLRWDRVHHGNPAGYATTVLTHLNIDRVRRLRREILRPSPSADIAIVEASGFELEPWVIEALATLSPRQRTVIALRFVEDLDMKGIAERMNCSVGTVKSQLSRALERIRQHHDQHERQGTRSGRS